MAKIRQIQRNPSGGKNYFIVDAGFLISKYLPLDRVSDPEQKASVEKSLHWWGEIDSQLRSDKARVCVPDPCLAKVFSTLAHKHFADRWFQDYTEYGRVRTKLIEDTTTPKILNQDSRQVKYHEITTPQDVTTSFIFRFFEAFQEAGYIIEPTDLVVRAAAEYLIDYYDIQRNQLQIVTLVRGLRDGSEKIPGFLNIYNPIVPEDERSRVFI